MFLTYDTVKKADINPINMGIIHCSGIGPTLYGDDWKCEIGKCRTVKNAGVENAGRENAARYVVVAADLEAFSPANTF